MQRLRAQLREYFPAAVAAFEDLDARTRWSCWAPDPARAAKLTRALVSAVLKHAGRRYKVAARTDAILAALRSPQLGQPPVLTAAYAATVPVPDRGHRHPERAGRRPAGAGGGTFWPAPGR